MRAYGIRLTARGAGTGAGFGMLMESFQLTLVPPCGGRVVRECDDFAGSARGLGARLDVAAAGQGPRLVGDQVDGARKPALLEVVAAELDRLDRARAGDVISVVIPVGRNQP